MISESSEANIDEDCDEGLEPLEQQQPRFKNLTLDIEEIERQYKENFEEAYLAENYSDCE